MLPRITGFTILILLLLAACQQQSPVASAPTVVPFPTMTPGRMIQGALSPLNAASENDAGLANPATAVALANQPTATPDYSTCPATDEATLPDTRPAGSEIARAITDFLSSGGSASALEEQMRDQWSLLGETGRVRQDVDLTGEGSAEILVAYGALGESGTLLILGCAGGRYQTRYQAISPGFDPPQILWAGDVNFDRQADLLFATSRCLEDDPEDCEYQTQLITWDGASGRFVSLLSGSIDSRVLPTLNDIDDDQVSEIVIRMNNPGTASTGPLRTGVNIYDWNGAFYTLSITQLDPPRFRIQIVHQADRAFARRDFAEAIALYELSLNDGSLRYWFNDGPGTLQSYTLYRLLLAYAFTEGDLLLSTYQNLFDIYGASSVPPVYATMGFAFWDAFQVTNNLQSACLEVREIIGQRPEALTLLNRYGSESPVYSPLDLCPF